MRRFEIRTIVSSADLDSAPKISRKVGEYIWDYIYDNLLKEKKIWVDDKFKYRITFDLKKFDPEKHKFFGDSIFNTDDDKFRPEPRFNKQGDLKFALLSVISTKLDEDIALRAYADLIYDALGSFLVLTSKKVTKDDLDKLKKGMDYEQIETFRYPATPEETGFFII